MNGSSENKKYLVFVTNDNTLWIVDKETREVYLATIEEVIEYINELSKSEER